MFSAQESPCRRRTISAMKRTSSHGTSLRTLARNIEALADRLDRGDTVERSAFAHMAAALARAERQALGPRPKAGRGHGAKGELLRYLLDRVGQPVYREELAAISGIQEWPRRTRELRVQMGYDIRSSSDGVYELAHAKPDSARAERWKVIDEVRRRKGSARDRVKALLEAFVGKPVSRWELDQVGKRKETVRRLRELRDEEGWPIASHIDDPSLGRDEYRLLSGDPSDRREPAQRYFTEALRQKVFKRDGYRCQMCGRNREEAMAEGDSRFYLEVHHKVALADRIAKMSPRERNDLGNLMTVCHRDHVKMTAQLQKRSLKSRRAQAARGTARGS